MSFIKRSLPPKAGGPATELPLMRSVIRRDWKELMKLNLLFLLTCLPIITIPAARTAMARICLLLLRDRPCVLRRDYWRSFRENFRDSSKAGLAFYGGEILCLYGAFFYRQLTAHYPLLWGVVILLALLLFVLLLVEIHLYPALAYLQIPLRASIKNAFLLTFLRFPRCLATFFVKALLVAATFLVIPITPFMLLCALFSLSGLVDACCAWTGMREYRIVEEEQS